jgi:hypothetical protein
MAYILCMNFSKKLQGFVKFASMIFVRKQDDHDQEIEREAGWLGSCGIGISSWMAMYRMVFSGKSGF